MTRGEIRAEVEAVIGVDSDDATYLNNWIYQGSIDVMAKTRCRVRPFTIGLNAGQDDFSFNSPVLYVISITNYASATRMPMERRSLAELEDMRRGAAAPPARYWAFAGSDLLSFYPTPGSGETVRGYYVPQPALMDEDSDSPEEIPDEYHDAIVLYVKAKAGEHMKHESSNMGILFWAQYNDRISQIKTQLRLRAKPQMTLTPMRRKRRYIPHDPSEDVYHY